MNECGWLSRYVVLMAPVALLTIVGCGSTVEPTDAAAPADAGPDTSVSDGGSCTGLDDGVTCTADTCVGGAAVHSPDDGACDSFGAGPVCDSSGRITQDVGVCDPTTDCGAETQTNEDCTDPVPTAACTGSASTDDLTFRAAMGICDDASGTPSCEQSSTPCEATTPPSCAGGMLTAATPTCDGVAGCGEGVATADCETRPARCEGPTHIVYTPSCADSTSCLPLGAEERTTCATPATSCVGLVHTTWAATCDATTGCGSTALIETDCGATAGSTCTGPRSYTLTTCRCDAVLGCSCSDEFFFCTVVCCP